MSKCCACHGSAPAYKCHCVCHRQEDLEYWEVMAFMWIFDAVNAVGRAAQWARFCIAYPEFAREEAEEFFERIKKSRWHHKHKHHHHKHHPYDHDDKDGD